MSADCVLAGLMVSSPAGLGRRVCTLSLSTPLNNTQVSREIPGKRDHAGIETQAEGGIICISHLIGKKTKQQTTRDKYNDNGDNTAQLPMCGSRHPTRLLSFFSPSFRHPPGLMASVNAPLLDGTGLLKDLLEN